mmetsp:Transcript_9492/g.28149  ORF Transcript_9492/g.28149 Transcript_9492/m.28149 type:complete len:271 (-) Transcript_9492:353-1165(-)
MTDATIHTAVTVAVAACGAIGAACFALLLAPQAYLNHTRRSTEGLSVALVILWHVGSLVYGGALLADGASFWLLASMGCFCVMSAVLEGQLAVYRYAITTPILVVITVLSAVSMVGVYGLSLVFALAPATVRMLLGDALPAVFFGIGFFPQLKIFVHTRSIAGYSFGVTAFDVAGAAANVAVLVLEDKYDVAGGKDAPSSGEEQAVPPNVWVEALPFLTIIALHFVLVVVALWVVMCAPKGQQSSHGGNSQHGDDPMGPGNLDESLLTNA